MAALFAIAPGSARSDEVDTLFEQGSKALKKADFKTAHEKLSKAWQLRKSIDIAANLAQAERRLGLKRDAANHLAYALAYFPPSGDDGVKRQMATFLAELEPHLCKVIVTTEPGATIKVGDEALGLTPLAAAVYLDPGDYVFSAEKGKAVGTAKLTARKGAAETVRIDLKDASAWALPSASASSSASAAPSASTAPTSDRHPPRDDRPKWPGFVAGGVGLVGVAIGGGLLGAGAASRSDVEESAADVVGCPDAPSCQTLVDDLSSADTLSNAGVGTLIAGGALLTTGVVLIVWSYATGDTDVAAEAGRLLPVVGPEHAGARWQLTF